MAEVADEDDLVVQSVSKTKRNKTKRRKKRHKLTPSSSKQHLYSIIISIIYSLSVFTSSLLYFQLFL